MVPACAAMPTFFFFLTYILASACVCVDKSEDDVERESQLLECRLTLTEERNAVLVPSAGSGIPGAPVERFLLLNSAAFFWQFSISFILFSGNNLKSLWRLNTFFFASASLQGSSSWHGDPCSCSLPGSQRYTATEIRFSFDDSCSLTPHFLVQLMTSSLVLPPLWPEE